MGLGGRELSEVPVSEQASLGVTRGGARGNKVGLGGIVLVKLDKDVFNPRYHSQASNDNLLRLYP